MSTHQPSIGPASVIESIRHLKLLTEIPAPDVEAGSELADDTAKSAVYDVGHAAWSSFVGAADHLYALQALITEARLIHSYAPFSLIRGAIDNAALALWLLAPTDQAERLFRRLHLAYEEVRRSADAYTLLGPGAPQPPRTSEVRMQEISDLAKQLGVSPNGEVGAHWAGYGRIVRIASLEVANLDQDVCDFVWRACSAVGHGRQWPALALLQREAQPRSPGVLDVRLTQPIEQILGFANLAVMLTQRGHALFEERRQALPAPKP